MHELTMAREIVIDFALVNRSISRNDSASRECFMKSPYPLPPRDAPADTEWLGGPVAWFSITLSISGDEVDPTAISDLLRVRPDSAWKKGERLPASGRLRSFSKWSICLRREDTDEWNVEAAICSVLDRVAVRGDVWKSAVGDAHARLFVGLSLDSRNRGFGLSPRFLRRIADLQVQLDFHLYAGESLGGAPDVSTPTC
jgi:hypothetical protein